MPIVRMRTGRGAAPIRLAGAVALAVALQALVTVGSIAATAPVLKRYPYLTDVTTTSVLVNLATDTPSTPSPTNSPPVVTWSLAGGSCAVSSANANAGITITVAGVTEYQYKAKISGLSPNTAYCYRVTQNGTDLLGADPSPTFTTALSAGATNPFSFAVLGDWGAGTAPEANVLGQIAASSAKFIVTTGDNAYNNGNQTDYGDLTAGNVFGPAYWKQVGPTRPTFATHGNHGFSGNTPYITNWPQDSVVAASGGKFLREPYCGADPGGTNPPACGSGSSTYASSWFAFDWGIACYYILEGAWSDGCEGHPSAGAGYHCDFLGHFNGPIAGCTPCGTELTWLQNDLAAHTSTPLKFAFFHYPLYSDNSGQPSDTWLSGSTHLEGLMANNNVEVVFNGHSHQYERNFPQIPGSPLVNYVTGGGGDPLGGPSGCSAFDAYSVGSKNKSCHAPPPANDVFHYLLVNVNGAQVTVTPTDQLGATFDVQTYDFSSTVQGTVTDASTGTPIAGATVSSGGVTTTTNGSGFYTLAGLLPGTPSVTASAATFRTVTQTVSVGPTKTATANIALPPNVRVAANTSSGLWAGNGFGPGFFPLGGSLTAAPAVVAVPSGTAAPPMVLYIATGQPDPVGRNPLYIRSDTQPWQELAPNQLTSCLDNPAAAVTGPAGSSVLTVACQGTDHSLYANSTPVTYGTLPTLPANPGWALLGGVMTAGPAIASVSGTLTFFVTGQDNAIWSRTLAADFVPVFGGCNGHPAAASNGSTAYLACNGHDHALWTSRNTGGGWTAPVSVGGYLIDGPGIAATNNGATFFIEGGDGAVWQRSMNAAGTLTTGWSSDGGAVGPGVGATSTQ